MTKVVTSAALMVAPVLFKFALMQGIELASLPTHATTKLRSSAVGAVCSTALSWSRSH